ncbi:pRL2-19 [Streptomyces vinaceus]|uniref:pRL2-19 n=1 Tax=Streptomyces vinaceus TaxID=1960 RepID=UPI00368140A2
MTALPRRPEEMSHAMLIAILMHNGGSLELPASAFAADSTGTNDGEFHAVELRPVGPDRVRLSVVPRPTGRDDGAVEIRD